MITYHFTPRIAGLAAPGLVWCLALAPMSATAASSAWVETEGGRIRVSALEPSADGTIRAALDIELLPGWKTYWRDPGESGVPPSFKVDRSDNIQSAQIHFPAPERIKDAYSTWAGYSYPVVLPITMKQTKAGEVSLVEADVFLGICESVCIPLQTTFSLTVDPGKPANAFERRLVKKAFASLPEAPGDDFDVVDARTGEGNDGFTVSVALPQADENSELFVTGPQGWRFHTPRLTGLDANVATFHVEVDGEGGLSGQTLDVIVNASGRSMETRIRLP
ncbi:protein-disulfide reductase DsbD domain-containing protein [Hoeflea poritis]|uniref:Protein-disulfide reductase DsbD family protein n=1 Tax=Hoeflea poritis TaxID=2993659 RepID=A0ABT4VJH6_9HYPH|nr:protein-disulfide reductase DsbD domain-containing protein [Hoeflea poritis]MDA4844810.1 protein-disulfide reductase DsbD family protein [Hoeflea poritis]